MKHPTLEDHTILTLKNKDLRSSAEEMKDAYRDLRILSQDFSRRYQPRRVETGSTNLRRSADGPLYGESQVVPTERLSGRPLNPRFVVWPPAYGDARNDK